jgi:hypothetical protein
MKILSLCCFVACDVNWFVFSFFVSVDIFIFFVLLKLCHYKSNLRIFSLGVWFGYWVLQNPCWWLCNSLSILYFLSGLEIGTRRLCLKLLKKSNLVRFSQRINNSCDVVWHFKLKASLVSNMGDQVSCLVSVCQCF